MAALIDPISGLSYGWALGEDNWNTGMDANLVQLGVTVNINVEDFVASPTATSNGTRYLVTTGTGAFAGNNGKLAARVGSTWLFYTVPEGCIIYRKSNTSHYKREGGSNVLLVDLSAYLTASTASSTYQTQSGMSSYLTTATAGSTYQTQSGMSSYLTTSSASSTYGTIANSRFVLETIADTTYTLAVNKVTSNGRYVLEFSDNAFTSLTLPTPTSLGVTTGDSVQVRITGTYAAQTLVAGSGATIEGTEAFNAQWHTKTLIAKSSTVWSVVG